MKRNILIICGTILLGIITGLTSCSNDKDDDTQVQYPVENVRYYVKYEMHISQANSGAISINCISDKGSIYIKTQNSDWNAVYGPIDKNTELRINASYSGPVYNKPDSYVRIYISRNNEPFVLKAEDRHNDSSKSYETSCNIDY